MLTIIVGGVSGLMSYIGYVLAAPDLQAIVNGEDPDPIPAILESSLGTAGSKIFLCIAITAFISCVLSLQAAGSRLIYASARDRMLPFSGWLSRMSERHAVPTNALLVACVVPILICLYVYAVPDQLPRITAFAVLGIYIAFQAVVLAALRQRLKGWRPAGNWNLGRYGFAVNVLALCYGIFAMVLLLKPGDTGSFLDRWVVAIGLAIVLVTGLLYLMIARPTVTRRRRGGRRHRGSRASCGRFGPDRASSDWRLDRHPGGFDTQSTVAGNAAFEWSFPSGAAASSQGVAMADRRLGHLKLTSLSNLAMGSVRARTYDFADSTWKDDRYDGGRDGGGRRAPAPGPAVGYGGARTAVIGAGRAAAVGGAGWPDQQCWCVRGGRRRRGRRRCRRQFLHRPGQRHRGHHGR